MVSKYLFRALFVGEDISDGCKGAGINNLNAELSEDEERDHVIKHVKCNIAKNNAMAPPIISLTDRLDIACKLAYNNKKNSKETDVVAVDYDKLDRHGKLLDLSTYDNFLDYKGEYKTGTSTIPLPKAFKGQTYANFDRDKFSSRSKEYCHVGPIPKENVHILPKKLAKSLEKLLILNPSEENKIIQDAVKFFQIGFEVWSKGNLLGPDDRFRSSRNREAIKHHENCCIELFQNYIHGNYIDYEDLLIKNGVKISSKLRGKLRRGKDYKYSDYGITEQQIDFLKECIGDYEKSPMMNRRLQVYDHIDNFIQNPERYPIAYIRD